MPAPARIAAVATSAAAPVMPAEPAITAATPDEYLCASGARAGSTASTSRAGGTNVFASPTGMPMSATNTRIAGRLAQQQEATPRSGAGQMPGHGDAVAAVVALAGDDHDTVSVGAA